jgi:hypothetical protein
VLVHALPGQYFADAMQWGKVTLSLVNVYASIILFNLVIASHHCFKGINHTTERRVHAKEHPAEM